MVNVVDMVVYNVYIDVCVYGGDYDGARATFERMKTTSNCVLNICLYNGVIFVVMCKKYFLGVMWVWEEIEMVNL